MSKVEQKTKVEGKSAIVESIILSDSKTGLTREGKAFVEAYESRVLCGKAFAASSQSLQAAKSEETKIFWGKYAIPKEGFAGETRFIAPDYDETILWERLKALGWQCKRLPTGQKLHCKKLRIPLSVFEKAALCQEEAARAALRKSKEDTFDFAFPAGMVEAFAKCISEESPISKLVACLQRQAAEYLRNE